MGVFARLGFEYIRPDGCDRPAKRQKEKLQHLWIPEDLSQFEPDCRTCKMICLLSDTMRDVLEEMLYRRTTAEAAWWYKRSRDLFLFTLDCMGTEIAE